MTEAETITEECERRSVTLSIGESSNVLAFDAPAGVLTPDLRAQIVAHKADIIELLFEREERAALQDCPDWMDAGKWQRVTSNPAIQKLQSLGLCNSIVDVMTTKRENDER
jgi:hypothetical protein